MMRLGVEPKGIIGSGLVISPPVLDEHWAENSDTTKYVGVTYEILSETPIIPHRALLKPPFKKFNFTPRPSGNRIPSDIVARLEDEWLKSTGQLGRASAVRKAAKFEEGRRIAINSYTYERHDEARKRCIDHYGYACQICGFDFEARYGNLGQNYIQVHHIKPLSEIGKRYQVNPIKDLIPVCANCHAMIHRQVPALSITQIKTKLRHDA